MAEHNDHTTTAATASISTASDDQMKSFFMSLTPNPARTRARLASESILRAQASLDD
jgi:hypothetical protein